MSRLSTSKFILPFSELKNIRSFDWYDGPLSGLCEVNGKHFFFYCFSEYSHSERTFRIFNLYKIPKIVPLLFGIYQFLIVPKQIAWRWNKCLNRILYRWIIRRMTLDKICPTETDLKLVGTAISIDSGYLD